MSLFPSQSVPLDDISFRARQPYVTSGGNRKFAGLPPGIYRGLVPTIDPFNNQRLLLSADPTFGDHIAMGEAPGGYAIHVRTTGVYALDFTGQPFADFPLYAYLEVSYVAPPIVGDTTATVRSVAIRSVTTISALTPAIGDRVAVSDVLGGTVTAPALPGTVTVTNLSAAVLGVGTAFTTQLAPGQVVQFASQLGTNYVVASITDDTHLTLATVFSGTTAVGTTTLPALVVRQSDILQFNGTAWTFLFPAVVRVCRIQKAAPAAPITCADNDNALGQTAVTSDTFVPTNRQTPVAYQGVTLGFMPGGSIEALEAAEATTLEVTNARVGIAIELRGSLTFSNSSALVAGDEFAKFTLDVQPGDMIAAPNLTQVAVLSVIDDRNLNLVALYPGPTTVTANPLRTRTWPDLETRLNNELAGNPSVSDNVARRLGKTARPIAGTPRPNIPGGSPGGLPGWAASGSNANVSSDFRSIPPSTGPRVKGVLVAPFNIVDNIVIVADANYNEVADPLTNYSRVYGRLFYDEQLLAGSNFAFAIVAGVVQVTGTGTTFSTQVQPGDIIQGVDGNYYTVDHLDGTTPDTLLYLAPAVPSPPVGSIAVCQRRRFTLQFVEFAGGIGGSESSYSFPPPSAFRYWSHQVFDVADMPFQSDFFLANSVPGKSAPNLPDGTASLKGKVFAAVADGQAGAIRTVTTPSRVFDNIRQINFTAPGSDPSGILNPSPGILTIALIGPPGPVGPGGGTGGSGGSGPPGAGFTTQQYNVFSGALAAGSINFTNDFSGAGIASVKFAFYTFSGFQQDAGPGPNDQFAVSTMNVTGSVVTVSGTMTVPGGPDLHINLMMGAAG